MIPPPIMPITLPTELDASAPMSLSLPKSLRRLRTYTKTHNRLSRDISTSDNTDTWTSHSSTDNVSTRTRRRPLGFFYAPSSGRSTSHAVGSDNSDDELVQQQRPRGSQRRSSSRDSARSSTSATSSSGESVTSSSDSGAVQTPTPCSSPEPATVSNPATRGGDCCSTNNHPSVTATTTFTNTSNTTNAITTSAAADAADAGVNSSPAHREQNQDDEMTRARSATTGDATMTITNPSDAVEAPATTTAANSTTPETAPSIRFSTYFDTRSTRPSLSFPSITRTLPSGTEIIRVGRYSERDSQLQSNTPGNQPSAAPVGFKSKVVSRRHCEFWCEDGKWYVRDVKSSSGTFLNHIRLSPPSTESKAYPINDGDIIQLGIDFKGGEEMIFRCVKMRVELNRGWQTKLNSFNVAAHKRLRTMATNGESPAGNTSQDCSICLNAIAPCQSLFVAPCSHTWHFKCVRSLLMSPQYPTFLCPNCRAGADLEADVDEPEEDWMNIEDEEAMAEQKPVENGEQSTQAAPAPTASESVDQAASNPEDVERELETVVRDVEAMDTTVQVDSPERLTNGNRLPHVPSEPVDIPNPSSTSASKRTPSPSNGEGPTTPRNDAGPLVFGNETANGNPGMASLNAAATAADTQ